MLSKACAEVRSMIYLEEWPYFITIKNKVTYTVKPGKVNSLFGNESYSKYWTKYPILGLYAVGHVKKKLGDKFDFCIKNQKSKKIVELFQMHIDGDSSYRLDLLTTSTSMCPLGSILSRPKW